MGLRARLCRPSRAAELAILARARDDAAGGRGQFVAIHGEAGVGRTRLIRTAVDEWGPNRLNTEKEVSKAMIDSTHWVGTWTAAPAPAEGAAFANHTLRMIPRVSIGGSRLRVRISNA